MFWTGLLGFLAGMIVGAVINRILLRNIPQTEWRTNRDLKLKYGALNWVCGLAGICVAIFIKRMWLA